jgi:NAD(P)H dehydrogenase (quinone)
MHALIVVSHPDSHSLSHGVAAAMAKGITANPQHTAEIVDLTAEGFNPTFTAQDFAAFKLTAPVPADIVAEQARIDKADALVLVFPVYWWSMPALLKGWIDRVFTNGWAYEETAEGDIVKSWVTCRCISSAGRGKPGRLRPTWFYRRLSRTNRPRHF